MKKTVSLGLATLLFATLGAAPQITQPTLLAAEMGSIKGTALNSSGAPAAGLLVRFFAPVDPTGGRGPGGGAGGRSAIGFEIGSPTHLQGKGTVAAQATTDEKGNFEIKSIAVGKYRYIAGTPRVGLAGGSVTVEAGKTAQLDLKLNAPAG